MKILKKILLLFKFISLKRLDLYLIVRSIKIAIIWFIKIKKNELKDKDKIIDNGIKNFLSKKLFTDDKIKVYKNIKKYNWATIGLGNLRL